MVVIIDEEAFIIKLIEAMAETRKAHNNQDAINVTAEWVLLKQAQEILPYRSKKKWKELRDSHALDFSVHGRQFLYNRDSLLRYIALNSTLKNVMGKVNLKKTKHGKES